MMNEGEIADGNTAAETTGGRMADGTDQLHELVSREMVEARRNVLIQEISPSHPDFEKQVQKFLECEIRNDFTVLNTERNETLVRKTKLRMVQIREGGMCVWYVEDDQSPEKEYLATSVLVINNRVPSISGQRVMGKVFDPSYQAWAAGTVVDNRREKNMRNLGVGTQLGERQHAKARELGRHEVLTDISSKNASSIAVRLNHLGYRLVEVNEDNTSTGGDAGYHYVKNLDTELNLSSQQVTQLAQDAQERRIQECASSEEMKTLITEGKSPDQLLVDPQNAPLVRTLTENGYVGIYLLRSTDFEGFANPLLKTVEGVPEVKFVFQKDDGNTRYKNQSNY